jgi:hypothetical protein
VTRTSSPPRSARARALAPALVAAVVGAGLLFFLAGPLGVTSGLLIVTAATGWIVGLVLKARDVGGPPGSRVATAVGISLAAVVVAWLATWGWSRAEGGALGPVDFLAQVYGILVLAQAAFAAVGALLGAR